MSVIIKEAVTKKDMRKFVQFANDLYKDCEYYCPPLFSDELETLDRTKNPAFDVCEAIYYLAYREGKIVGRIAGIVNRQANKAWDVKKLRFGWVDFIDDLEVSKALFDAVLAWGKAKGMNQMNGPVGFTDLDHQGLLIEGYEYLSLMAALYNFPYYVKHFEAYGLVKEADWVETRCPVPAEAPAKMQRVGAVIQKRFGVKVENVHNYKELMKRYGYSYFDLIDEAYRNLYNYSPLTEKQKIYYSKIYFPIVNYDFVTFVTNEAGEMVAVGIVMPNISKALRKSQGKLFPFGWYHLLKALKSKKIEEVDLLLIAVRPDYQNMGVNSLLFLDQIPKYHDYGVKYANVTAVLETNMKSLANFVDIPGRTTYKRRRAYVKSI